MAYELAKYKDETSEMFLFEMGIDESYRRRGIGTTLIEGLKDICRYKGISEMFVDALAENLSAYGLYKSTGGKPEKVVEFTYKVKALTRSKKVRDSGHVDLISPSFSRR